MARLIDADALATRIQALKHEIASRAAGFVDEDSYEQGAVDGLYDALTYTKEAPTVDAVPLDKLAEWLARNYEPTYDIDEVHKLTWPVDYTQQKEAWMKILKKLMKED